jgi:hypothetical protein
MCSHCPIKCVAGEWQGLSLARHFLSFARSGRQQHDDGGAQTALGGVVRRLNIGDVGEGPERGQSFRRFFASRACAAAVSRPSPVRATATTAL